MFVWDTVEIEELVWIKDVADGKVVILDWTSAVEGIKALVVIKSLESCTVGSLLGGVTILDICAELDGMSLESITVLVGMLVLEGTPVSVCNKEVEGITVLVWTIEFEGIDVLVSIFKLEGIAVIVWIFELEGIAVLVWMVELEDIDVLASMIELESVTSIKESLKGLVKVFPNASSEKLTIETETPGTLYVSISSMNGDVIVEDSFTGSKTLNIHDFEQGAYFLRIEGDGKFIIEKIMIQR